jgi:hypothetical protein
MPGSGGPQRPPRSPNFWQIAGVEKELAVASRQAKFARASMAIGRKETRARECYKLKRTLDNCPERI